MENFTIHWKKWLDNNTTTIDQSQSSLLSGCMLYRHHNHTYNHLRRPLLAPDTYNTIPAVQSPHLESFTSPLPHPCQSKEIHSIITIITSATKWIHTLKIFITYWIFYFYYSADTIIIILIGYCITDNGMPLLLFITTIITIITIIIITIIIIILTCTIYICVMLLFFANSIGITQSCVVENSDINGNISLDREREKERERDWYTIWDTLNNVEEE